MKKAQNVSGSQDSEEKFTWILGSNWVCGAARIKPVLGPHSVLFLVGGCFQGHEPPGPERGAEDEHVSMLPGLSLPGTKGLGQRAAAPQIPTRCPLETSIYWDFLLL